MEEPFFTLHAEQSFAYADVWAGVLLLALLGVLLNLAFTHAVERRVLFWQRGSAAL